MTELLNEEKIQEIQQKIKDGYDFLCCLKWLLLNKDIRVNSDELSSEFATLILV